MLHIRSVSTGVAGSPFYTNLYFNAAMAERNTATAVVRKFWADLATVMRAGIQTSVESDVREINPLSGAVIDIQSADELPNVPTSGVGNVAPPATQGLVRLNTGGVRFNRRVRGRIFIPGVSSASVTDVGGVSSFYQNTVQTAADRLATITNGVSLCVWSRPQLLLGAVTRPGAAFNVSSTSVWDQFAVLRSRRD